MANSRPRRGRRPGPTASRDAVLAAARARFADQGYDATTMRQVAGDAAVDPALVHYFFGSKAELFVAAVEYPVDPAEVVARLAAMPRDGIGEEMARVFLEAWRSDRAQPLFALLRSVAAHENAAAMLREFISREVVGRLARDLGLDRPDLRAALCGSQLVGLATIRHVVPLEPLASAETGAVAAWVGPTLQRYLTAPLP